MGTPHTLVRQMLQGRHINCGGAHQISPGLAEAGAMAWTVPFLLMWVPLHKQERHCLSPANHTYIVFERPTHAVQGM